jgi:hypothetical protein
MFIVKTEVSVSYSRVFYMWASLIYKLISLYMLRYNIMIFLNTVHTILMQLNL